MKFFYPATIALTAVATIAHATDLCGPSLYDENALIAGRYKIYHGSGEFPGQLCSTVDSFTDHTISFHTIANIPETSSDGTAALKPVTFAAAQLQVDSKRVGDIKSIPVELYHTYTFKSKQSSNVGLSMIVGSADPSVAPVEILVWMTGQGGYTPEKALGKSTEYAVINGGLYDKYRRSKLVWYVPRMGMFNYGGDLFLFLNDSLTSSDISIDDYVHKVQAVTEIITANDARFTVSNFSAQIL
ncbi:putative glycoside hydrolase family 12, glycoside hydrolase family [Plasmopara halstedii]